MTASQRQRSPDLDLRTHGTCDRPVIHPPRASGAATTRTGSVAVLPEVAVPSCYGYPIERLLLRPVNLGSRQSCRSTNGQQVALPRALAALGVVAAMRIPPTAAVIALTRTRRH